MVLWDKLKIQSKSFWRSQPQPAENGSASAIDYRIEQKKLVSQPQSTENGSARDMFVVPNQYGIIVTTSVDWEWFCEAYLGIINSHRSHNLSRLRMVLREKIVGRNWIGAICHNLSRLRMILWVLTPEALLTFKLSQPQSTENGSVRPSFITMDQLFNKSQPQSTEYGSATLV